MAIFKEGSLTPSDRSQWDRKRHRKLVEDAVKRNMGDLIAEESIIGQDRNKKFKIPVRGIKEYQFTYGRNNSGASAGAGNEQRGQVVGQTNGESQGQVIGGPGQEAGEDIYEAEVTIDEITQYLFEDLQLPDMDRKRFATIDALRKCKLSGYQKKGIPPRLAKKRTVMEKLKRTQTAKRNDDTSPELTRNSFIEDDLRYRRIKEEVRPHSNAVVICIMDTSGSMDQTRKYLARSFYFLLYQFIRYKYEHVEVAFVAHSTEAKEVTEQEFFHKGESGGTFISSGYEKALEIIEQRYNPSVWNIYAFHCSDGDNWAEDDSKAVSLAKELCAVCNLFGYGEVGGGSPYSTIKQKLADGINDENFVITSIASKLDVWPAFKRILEKDGDGGGDNE